MRGEYDLVIIGGSFTARYAAGMAAQQGFRVALVEPPTVKIQPFSWGKIYQVYQNLQNLPDQGNRSTFLDYSQTAANFLQQEFDLAGLSRSGVDVIVGRGEFQQLPQLAFVIDQRILRSHRYLLAPELIPSLPAIPGLESVGYVTPANLVSNLVGAKLGNDSGVNSESDLQPNLGKETATQSWIVMGNPYIAAEMSQLLKNLGKTVTLVSPKEQLFPQEEPIANALIQAEIEAAGIRLLTHSPVTLIKHLEGKLWVQAGDRAIEAEQILLCPRQIPHTTGLNLATAGVQVNRNGIVVNQRLQTTNPHIYACSDRTGSGTYQVAIALKNALILPIFSANHHQPCIIHTQPPLARIGMTEQEARHKNGKQVITLREYVKNQPLAQLRGETTGFCQLIVHRNGRILGATIVCSQAVELISLVTLAIDRGLKVGDLTQLPEANGSLLQRMADQWLLKQSKFYYIWQEIKCKVKKW